MKVGKRMVMTILALLATGLVLLILWAWTPDLPRSTLEAQYLEQPGDLVDVSGIRLHVRDRGDKSAPAVMLVHGTASHLQTWDGWAKALERDFRVITLDLPGNALSGLDPAGDYSDERTVEVLLALMDTLGMERASLIGSSLGGRIAWLLAATHQERVSKLVLVSPDGFASNGFEYGKPPEVPSLLDAAQYVLPKRFLRSSLAAAYADPSKLSEETFERYYGLMRAPGSRGAILARMRQTVLQPPEPLLRKITMPVLLVWGEKDQMIPISNAADYLGALPDARLVRLPDAGHVPQEEVPDTSIAPVIEFLRQD